VMVIAPEKPLGPTQYHMVDGLRSPELTGAGVRVFCLTKTNRPYSYEFIN
jgi:hypothetical protein